MLDERFAKALNLTREDFPTLWVLQNFINNKLDVYSITKKFLNLIPGADKVIDVVDEVQSNVKAFAEYKADINASESSKLVAYQEGFLDKTGSIHESDQITRLIKYFIGKIQNANENKEVVLVVDDLDRLDPEHIFRLFNVFSSHYKNDYTKNKFDFNRILFVCDIANIHEIFCHKYGGKAEFSGYIDKFYSVEVFHFDNRSYLQEVLFSFIQTKYKGVRDKFYNTYCLANVRKNPFYPVFEFIVVSFVENGLLKLRNLSKFQFYGTPNYKIHTPTGREYDAGAFEFITIIFLLKQLFGRLNEIERAFSFMIQRYSAYRKLNFYLVNNKHPDYAEKAFIGYCLNFLVSDSKPFDNPGTAGPHYYSYKTINRDHIVLKYEWKHVSDLGYDRISFVSAEGGEDAMAEVNPFHTAHMAYQKAISKNWLPENMFPETTNLLF